MFRRCVAAALTAALLLQSPAGAYAAGAAAVSASIGKGAVVPLAPIQFSPASLGAAGITGTEAQAFALQGILQGVGSLNATPAALHSGPGAAAAQSGLQVRTVLSAVSGAGTAAAPVAGPAAAASAEGRATAPASQRQVSVQVQSMGRAAAPVLEAIRGDAASSSSHYSAGQRLADILSGQRTHAAADDVQVPQTQAPAVSGLAQGRQASESTSAAADTPAPAQLTKEQRRNFWTYALAASTTKVGIETLNLVVPILLLTKYGAATMVGALFICSELAGMLASWLAGPIIDKFSPTRVMAVSAGLQILFIGAIPLGLALGLPVGLPAIFTLFTLDGALIGVFDTARRAALPRIVGRNEEVLRKHNAYLYIVREILSVAAVGGAGLLLSKFGALSALAVHPAAYVIVALFMLKLLSGMPEKTAPAKAAVAAEKGAQRGGISEVLRGIKVIAKDPVLRLAAAVNIPVITLHRLMHAILAAVYATKVLGNPAYAALMLMAWNAGELAAAAYLNRTAKATGSFSWLKYIAAVSLTTWVLVFCPHLWAVLPAIFILSTGNMSSELGLTSFFQSIAKKEEAGSVIGVISALATGTSLLSLLIIGQVFDVLSAGTGFIVIAGIMTLMSVLYLAAYQKFKKLPPPPPANGIED